MNSSAIRPRNVLCLSALFASLAYLALHTVHHSSWYQNRLYQQLLHGRPEQRLAAATALTRVDGRQFLLRGLQSNVAEIRELSRRGLEHLWFTDAGMKAYQMILDAHEAASNEAYANALEILNRLVRQFPEFPEGWNRRASVHWQTGDYQKSIADSQRTLALNPDHYGAWQGLGICHLNLGNVQEACEALRASLKIIPHDDSTQKSLRECEDLLRTFPPPERTGRAELIL